MNFNRYFIASSYVLLVSGFGMLAATRQVDWVSLLLLAGALIAGVLIDTKRLRWSVSRRWSNLLILAYPVVALVEWQMLRSTPVVAVIHFVLFATSLKLLRAKGNRDWLWLYLVSFGVVLMAAGLMAGTHFLLLLVVYLFAALSTFISFEIYRSQQYFTAEIQYGERERPEPPLGERERPEPPLTDAAGKTQAAHAPGTAIPIIELWRETKEQRQHIRAPGSHYLISFSAAALISIMVIAVPLFLAVPRISRSFGRNSLLSTEALSGFSDTVRLGEVAQVKLNPQIVMRVRVKFAREQVNQAERQALRWRGVTLDQYDGQSWIQSGAETYPVRTVGDAFRVDDKLWPRAYTEQHFFVEPLNIRTVFVAPRPMLVTGLPELSRDAGDGLWTESHHFNKIEYTVYSDTSLTTDEELALENYRDAARKDQQRYVQLPPDHDRRIDQLAAEVTQGATTQIEIARRIERHLRDGYGYTLNLHQVTDGDPVADFLFNAREGHCEYFASAMVLMLRSRKIPARLVNGFQTGEYNATADVYTVRQSDAHSWVEAWFPKKGWVAFDPTPPAGLSNYDDGMLAWMRQYSEAMEMFWLEHVVGFDLNRQLSIAASVQRWMSFYQRDVSMRWFEWTSGVAQRLDGLSADQNTNAKTPEDGKKDESRWSNVLRHPAMLTITLTVILAVIAALAFFWRKRWPAWRRRAKQEPAESAIEFYQEMLRTLERAGHKREVHQTPQEFATQLALPPVSEITRLYQRTRFSDERLSDAEAAWVESLLQQLKRQARRNWKIGSARHTERVA
ncbi:MAG: transglutaminaseTgpA domain-containing protein [Acidobacteriota bacterium]|nr:transglutaminaseTgpA domain-containing protein [Acidobacteriota bacterium]